MAGISWQGVGIAWHVVNRGWQGKGAPGAGGI